MEDFKATGYTLRTVATGRSFEDTGWVIDDEMSPKPSLVRAK